VCLHFALRKQPTTRSAGKTCSWRAENAYELRNSGLRAHPKDAEAAKDEQIVRLKRKDGELVLDIDILKEANKGRPFGPGTSDE